MADMTKIPRRVQYDFEVDTFVSVEAPEGVDPDTLVEQVFAKLAQQAMDRQLEVVFRQVYDPVSGEYDQSAYKEED